MEEKDNTDRFKEALRKKLRDEPIHSEQEDLEIWGAIKSQLQAQPAKKEATRIHMHWYAYAACIVFGLVLSATAYFFLRQQPSYQVAQQPQAGKDSARTLPVEPKELAKQDAQISQEETNDKPKQVRGSTSEIVEVASESIEEHTLLDGSRVTLNKGGQISHGSDFKSKREVSLQGEAYFEVASDKTHPFVVNFGHHYLVVVGTKFNVRVLQEGNAEISVIEGIINVFPSDEGKGIQVKRNEQLLLRGNKAILGHVNAQNYIGWKTGELKFVDMKMEEVASLLSRQYQVKIEVDPVISQCIFTGNLNQVSFENALKILEMTTSFTIKVKSDNVYSISGSGCD